MGRLYILAGIPGSGKSTWAKNMLPEASLVSSDSIRKELFPSLKEAQAANSNGKVFELFHERVSQFLKLPENDVVADATSLTLDSRKKLLDIAGPQTEVHLILFVNTGQALSRNKQRVADLVVPDDVMGQKMLPRLRETQESLKRGEKNLYTSVTFIAAVS